MYASTESDVERKFCEFFFKTRAVFVLSVACRSALFALKETSRFHFFFSFLFLTFMLLCTCVSGHRRLCCSDGRAILFTENEASPHVRGSLQLVIVAIFVFSPFIVSRKGGNGSLKTFISSLAA